MINFDSSVFVATLTQLYEMSRNYAKYAGARRQLARSYNRDDFLELIRNEQTKTDPKDRQILLWSDIETMYQFGKVVLWNNWKMKKKPIT
jgi:HD superfamily phosphohydrolase YqeK